MGINYCLSRLYTKIKYPKLKIYKGAQVARGSSFEGANVVGKNTMFSGNVGYASCIADNCDISAKIGRYTSIGSRVVSLQYTHPTRVFVSTHPSFYSLLKQSGFTYVSKQKFDEYRFVDENKKYSVSIGSDCWIGSDAILFGGITIGDGAIVGAGAVVTKDVEPYSIVVGNPAKLLRKRFCDKDIDMLLCLKWWEKDENWIKDNAKYFDDIEKLKMHLENEVINNESYGCS